MKKPFEVGWYNICGCIVDCCGYKAEYKGIIEIKKITKCYMLYTIHESQYLATGIFKRKILNGHCTGQLVVHERRNGERFLELSSGCLLPYADDDLERREKDEAKGCFREVLNDLHKYFYYNQYNEDKPYYRAADMLVNEDAEEYVVFYD